MLRVYGECKDMGANTRTVLAGCDGIFLNRNREMADVRNHFFDAEDMQSS